MKPLCITDKPSIEFLAEAFNILSEPNRLKILCLLSKKKEICVCEIVEALDLKQNLVSHHLSMFKRIGIVDTRREGTNIYYTLNPEVYTKLTNLIQTVFNF